MKTGAEQEKAEIAAKNKADLLEMLKQENGHILNTGRRLGRSREWVRRWCIVLKIKPEKFRINPREWAVLLRGKRVGVVTAKTEKEALSKAVDKFTNGANDLRYLRVI